MFSGDGLGLNAIRTEPSCSAAKVRDAVLESGMGGGFESVTRSEPLWRLFQSSWVVGRQSRSPLEASPERFVPEPVKLKLIQDHLTSRGFQSAYIKQD